ncbi:MAG TPA: urea amidolyase associated protein UAAP1 [Acidisphaera sp.]|nr:urea amidolyase associated protein UAAP1 [Acidisphaera sp.]
MLQPHEMSPDQLRARYEALLDAARHRAKASAVAVHPGHIPDGSALLHETIPGGWYWSARLRRGTALRLANPHGTHGVSALFWNADDPSERYNAADTVKVQWTTHLTTGSLLLSDMGRVLMSVIADSGHGHDALLGGSTPETNRRRYGAEGLRNSRENLQLAAAKHGLDPRDVGPCLTFFASIRTDGDGAFHWQKDGAQPGAAIDLRAEMNVIAAISNCPHPLSPDPAYAPKPVTAIVWTPPPVGPDDPCRTAGIEAERAFVNTERFFGP